MRALNEDEAELFIEVHRCMQGWNLTDFTLTRKRWRQHRLFDEAQNEAVLASITRYVRLMGEVPEAGESHRQKARRAQG